MQQATIIFYQMLPGIKFQFAEPIKSSSCPHPANQSDTWILDCFIHLNQDYIIHQFTLSIWGTEEDVTFHFVENYYIHIDKPALCCIFELLPLLSTVQLKNDRKQWGDGR